MIKNFDKDKLAKIAKSKTKKGLIVLIVLVVGLIIKLIVD